MDKSLAHRINLLKNSHVGEIVGKRMEEFRSTKEAGIDAIFKELCFCILTANFSAERSIKIQKAIGNGFLALNEKALAEKLRSNGHRFPNTRASFIIRARAKLPELEKALSMEPKALREWLVDNICGFGYKEASHFLRNIGFNDFAIVDFHIVNLLVSKKLIRRPKRITPKNYLSIEARLSALAKEVGLSLGELDLYLWYMETGKVLK